jgi:hypothetical protein
MEFLGLSRISAPRSMDVISQEQRNIHLYTDEMAERRAGPWRAAIAGIIGRAPLPLRYIITDMVIPVNCQTSSAFSTR